MHYTLPWAAQDRFLHVSHLQCKKGSNLPLAASWTGWSNRSVPSLEHLILWKSPCTKFPPGSYWPGYWSELWEQTLSSSSSSSNSWSVPEQVRMGDHVRLNETSPLLKSQFWQPYSCLLFDSVVGDPQRLYLVSNLIWMLSEKLSLVYQNTVFRSSVPSHGMKEKPRSKKDSGEK